VQYQQKFESLPSLDNSWSNREGTPPKTPDELEMLPE